MKKIAYLSVIFAFAFVMGTAPAANAQYYYGNSNVSSCLSLSSYLAYGSSDSLTGGQVSKLQQFLNNTQYLNGVTGYFDVGTRNAVVNYQASHGISTTGTVGPITRSTINQQSCTGSYGNTGYSTGYNSGSVNGYYGNSLSISSLSTTAAQTGTNVTIYGSNLTGNNVVVHFGTITVPVNYSNSNSATFTVPSISNGTYQVYVSSAYGTSNSLQFAVTGNSYNNTGNNCYVNGSIYQCGCNTTYNSNYSYNNSSYNNCNGNGSTNGYNSVTLSSLSATSGYAGQTITIYGTGFSNYNTVQFQGSTINNVYSNGNSLTFTIPSGFSYGFYNVSVTNSNGYTSNSLTFNIVNSNNYNYNYNNNTNNGNNSYNGTWFGGNGQPSISSINGSANVTSGTSYTWSVNAYDQNGLPLTMRVDWGDGSSDGNTQNNYSGSQQQYSFTHSYGTSGTYTIRMTATDSNGAYAYSTLSTIVNGNNGSNGTYYGTPTISSLSQSSGYAGNTITLYGTNFTNNETVYFGNSNSYSAYSSNGNSLTFSVPYFNAGTYSVYVKNSNGNTSNAVNFTLWQ